MHYNGNCFIKWSTQKNFRWLWTPSNWLNLQTEEGNSIYSNMMLNQNDINWVSIISALSSWCSSVTAHLPTAKSQILTVVSALALARTFLEFITRSHASEGLISEERHHHLSWNENHLTSLFHARPSTELLWLPFLYFFPCHRKFMQYWFKYS